jgi:hypothetical protein
MIRFLGVLVGLVLVIASGSLVAQSRTVPKEFDRVRTLGRALSEFKDGRIQVVAAYYYSQLNHDSSWLLIQLGALGERAIEIHRDKIALVTPSGRVVQLASQARWAADSGRNTLLMQQASSLKHPVYSYFSPTSGQTGLRFFARPPGTGTVLEVVYVRAKELVLGDLLFESPTGFWEKGTYALGIRYDGEEAVLPIKLQ